MFNNNDPLAAGDTAGDRKRSPAAKYLISGRTFHICEIGETPLDLYLAFRKRPPVPSRRAATFASVYQLKTLSIKRPGPATGAAITDNRADNRAPPQPQSVSSQSCVR